MATKSTEPQPIDWSHHDRALNALIRVVPTEYDPQLLDLLTESERLKGNDVGMVVTPAELRAPVDEQTETPAEASASTAEV